MLQLQRKVTAQTKAGFISLTGLAAILMATACGGGLDTEEASAICTEIQDREPSQFDSDGNTFSTCVVCYEDCGNDCSKRSPDASGLATFQCEDDILCTIDGC